MKQMICLMSEQLIPSYLAVKHHKPDLVWRILTERTLREGRDRMFCETLKEHAGFPLHLPDCGHLIAESTNFESTRLLVKGLLGRDPEDEWVINVTGGNKMIAAGAILEGVIANRPLYYTDIAAPDHIADARTGKAQPFGQGLKVLEFLSLYGFSGAPDPGRWSQKWLDLAQLFAADPPKANPFQKLQPHEAKAAERSGLRNFKAQFTGSDPLREALIETAGCPDLTRRQYGFVTGKWLEAFLFDLIGKHRYALDIHDIQPGMRVTRAGVENELDIALTRGLDFIYIECKSGSQREPRAGNQIEEICGTLGRLRALRAKPLIATTGANFLDREAKELSQSARTRLREAGMNVLIRPDIAELATRRDATFIVSRLASFLTRTV